MFWRDVDGKFLGTLMKKIDGLGSKETENWAHNLIDLKCNHLILIFHQTLHEVTDLY